MKIKRYTATSMRAALGQVRSEQGPDAVILSSRRVSEGIEVIAAVDYDEALIAGAARRYWRTAASTAPTASSSAALADAAADAAAAPPATTPATAGPTAAANPRATTLAAARAAAPARAMTAATAPPTARETTPATARAAAPVTARAMTPATASATLRAPAPATAATAGRATAAAPMRVPRPAPAHRADAPGRHTAERLQGRVVDALAALDIAPDVAAALAELTPARTNLRDPSNLPLALLLRHLPVVESLSTVNSGVFAVVGPTGAGKTTTIAKLAARWTLQHGSRDLALVSTDAYRIGAREQLMTYARILGATMHAPNNGQELARVLERVKSKRLVLIDTAGMGPRDVRLAEQLAALKLGAERARFLLALPAQGEGHALEEIIRAFECVRPAACIITKVDEAASLGAVLSTALRHKLKIAYLCNGQRVPEDLHPAHRGRVWLVRAARKLKQQPRRDAAYFARNFTRAGAHA